MESPFRRAIRAMRSALVYGRLPNGPTFVFPIVQLATSLRSNFSPRAFSCRNMIGKLASAGEWKGWHSPSVSRHRMLSFTLNVSVPGARWIGVSSPFMYQPHESNSRRPHLRVCRAPVRRLARNRDQRDSEGEDGRTENPPRLPIARARSYHRKHGDHNGEADQESSDEAACLTKCSTEPCRGGLHDSLGLR